MIMGAVGREARKRGRVFSAPKTCAPQDAFLAMGADVALEPPVALHQVLREGWSLGWMLEPVNGALFAAGFNSIVARLGGDDDWVAMGVVQTKDRTAVSEIHWLGGGFIETPNGPEPIDPVHVASFDWVLLLVPRSMESGG